MSRNVRIDKTAGAEMAFCVLWALVLSHSATFLLSEGTWQSALKCLCRLAWWKLTRSLSVPWKMLSLNEMLVVVAVAADSRFHRLCFLEANWHTCATCSSGIKSQQRNKAELLIKVVWKKKKKKQTNSKTLRPPRVVLELTSTTRRAQKRRQGSRWFHVKSRLME